MRAELHKVNVYGPGGFFRRHKDTPRGSACFGSLVVTLPVPFEGGQLVCRHMGKRMAFPLNRGFHLKYAWGPDREAKLRAHVPPAELQWAAFFGDVEHEVEPVTSGHRVTLTYVLHRDAAPTVTPDALLLRASALHTELRAALARADFLPEGGKLGLRCRHLYEETQLAQAESKLKAGGAGAYVAKLKLKNEDAVVAAGFSACGLEVTCLRMLDYEYSEGGPVVLAKMPTKASASGFGTTRSVEGAFRAKTVTPDEVADYGTGVLQEVVGEVQWLGNHKATQQLWTERYFGEYFGNEACHCSFYTLAAVVAVVPPFGANGRELPRPPTATLTADHVRPPAASAPAGGAPKRKAASLAAGAGSEPALKRAHTAVPPPTVPTVHRSTPSPAPHTPERGIPALEPETPAALSSAIGGTAPPVLFPAAHNGKPDAPAGSSTSCALPLALCPVPHP